MKENDFTRNIQIKLSEGGKTFTEYANDPDDVRSMENDPVLSPNFLKTTMTDRFIFMGTTFILRALTLYLVEWAVYTGFLGTFGQAFGMYFGVYCALFLLWVILVNSQADDRIFRLIFYYINRQGERADARIAVHLLMQVILLPIPYIVSEYREEDLRRKTTFEEKRRVLQSIERITFFVWLTTSAIAFKL